MNNNDININKKNFSLPLNVPIETDTETDVSQKTINISGQVSLGQDLGGVVALQLVIVPNSNSFTFTTRRPPRPSIVR